MTAVQEAGQGGDAQADGPGGAGPVGIVLAGGRAARMGGGDKSLLPVGGRPILARILAVLQPHLAQVAISGNGPPERFAAFGCPVLPDLPSLRGAGPLAGLAAAAMAYPGRPLVTVPGDTPFLPAELVPRLLAACPAGGAVYIHSRGGDHPTIAAYAAGSLAALPGWLAGGGRAAMAWLAQIGGVPLDWPAPEDSDPFMNVNRPEDLAAARRVAEGRRAAGFTTGR